MLNKKADMRNKWFPKQISFIINIKWSSDSKKNLKKNLQKVNNSKRVEKVRDKIKKWGK